MKNRLILIIISVIMLISAASVNVLAAYDNVNANISMGRVHIKGTLPENSGKNISILCVDKGTDVTGEIAKEKIVYIDEVDNITNNEFEIAFNAETSIENIDIYINDSVFMEENPSTKSKLINIKDYADNYYFDAELNVDVLKKFTEYGIEANIKNIFGYEDVSCDILIACYAKDGKLLQVTKEGHNNYAQPYEKQLIIPEGTWSAKAYVWVNNKPITQSKVIDKNINPVKYDGTNADAAGYREITEETFIKANEPWFEYNGRWQADGENMISNWQRAYVKVAVEGKNITLNFAERGSYTRGRLIINGKLADWHIMLNNNEDNATNPNSADVNIDLSATKYSSYMSDEYNEIVIMSKSEGTRVGFKGMTVGEGSIVYKPIAKDLNMMFVGDSITAWSNDNTANLATEFSYSYQLPTALDADFTTIARSGISLYRPLSAYSTGMITQFNQYGSYRPIDDTNDVNRDPDRRNEFDFTNDDKFDLIFINLGTNDLITTVDDEFITKYEGFVDDLKIKYPSAKIVIIKPFRGNTGTGDKRNWNAIAETFDKIKTDYVETDTSGKVFFMDTADLIFDYETDYVANDNLHPNGTGHKKITDYMINWLNENGLI